MIYKKSLWQAGIEENVLKSNENNKLKPHATIMDETKFFESRQNEAVLFTDVHIGGEPWKEARAGHHIH